MSTCTHVHLPFHQTPHTPLPPWGKFDEIPGWDPGEVMPTACDHEPPPKAAVSLSQARAEEGLQLRGLGDAYCLASQLPVFRAPAYGLTCGAGLYGSAYARHSMRFGS
jgi:hypothetical protein